MTSLPKKGKNRTTQDSECWPVASYPPLMVDAVPEFTSELYVTVDWFILYDAEELYPHIGTISRYIFWQRAEEPGSGTTSPKKKS